MTFKKLFIGMYLPVEKLGDEFKDTFQMKIVHMVLDKMGLPKDIPITKMTIEIDGNSPIKINIETENSIK